MLKSERLQDNLYHELIDRVNKRASASSFMLSMTISTLILAGREVGPSSHDLRDRFIGQLLIGAIIEERILRET